MDPAAVHIGAPENELLSRHRRPCCCPPLTTAPTAAPKPDVVPRPRVAFNAMASQGVATSAAAPAKRYWVSVSRWQF